jgi:RNA polymerase sigma factor (sigma-70 family)
MEQPGRGSASVRMEPSHRPSRAERREAFARVVSVYEGPLLRYVSRMLRDFDAAQDVVQDAFIKLAAKWHEDLVPAPALSAWLYRVAHNGAIDHLRKRTRRRECPGDEDGIGADAATPDAGASDRQADESERALLALRTLSLREQQLVTLKVFEEKSYREISEITGLTMGNVGYILHFAMKKMAEGIRRLRQDEQRTSNG